MRVEAKASLRLAWLRTLLARSVAIRRARLGHDLPDALDSVALLASGCAAEP